jgi:predicted O-methyltransferase YrrM
MKFSVTKLITKKIIYDVQFEKLYREHVVHVKGWLSKEESYSLFKIAQQLTEGIDAIEIGSYEGKSTLSIAEGLKFSKLHAIDPHTGDITERREGLSVSTLSQLMTNLKMSENLPKVNVIVKTSEVAIAELRHISCGLIFIDGWHTKEAVMMDIMNYSKLWSNQCVVIIDDFFEQEVNLGVKECLKVLPKYNGTVGKMAIFGLNDNNNTVKDLILNDKKRKVIQRIRKRFNPK